MELSLADKPLLDEPCRLFEALNLLRLAGSLDRELELGAVAGLSHLADEHFGLAFQKPEHPFLTVPIPSEGPPRATATCVPAPGGCPDTATGLH